VTGVVGAGAAQVEVAVLETLLADGGALVDLERQRRLALSTSISLATTSTSPVGTLWLTSLSAPGRPTVTVTQYSLRRSCAPRSAPSRRTWTMPLASRRSMKATPP
jgi:hypothetical protein